MNVDTLTKELLKEAYKIVGIENPESLTYNVRNGFESIAKEFIYEAIEFVNKDEAITNDNFYLPVSYYKNRLRESEFDLKEKITELQNPDPNPKWSGERFLTANKPI